MSKLINGCVEKKITFWDYEKDKEGFYKKSIPPEFFYVEGL